MKVFASAGLLALAAIPLLVFFTALLHSSPSSPSLTNATSVRTSRSLASDRCPDPYSFVVFVFLDKLDVTNDTLDANVSLCMGDEARAIPGLFDQQGRSTATVSVQVLQPGQPSQTGTVILDPSSVLTRGLSQVGAVVRAVGTVTIPANGEPRDYPIDSYRASVLVYLQDRAGSSTPALFKVPLAFRVLADPGVSNFAWSSSVLWTARMQQEVNKSIGAVAQVIRIEGRRSVTTAALVLSLVLVPLVLIILLVVRLSTGPRSSLDGLVGVTAIMLAVLPIRTVLVPTEITSLTLVDFALASEMAVLAAGIVLLYAWPHFPKGRSPHAPPRRERS